MRNSIANSLFLIVSIMGLFLINPRPAEASVTCGVPTVAGVANLGVLAGQHYYEVNFNMPYGQTYAQWAACVGAVESEIWSSFVSGAPAHLSYSGPAGNSIYQYQVNIYGTPGSGFSEIWFGYGPSAFYPVGTVEVIF